MTRNGERIPDPDARLRRSLEPEPRTVDRVVQGALGARGPKRAQRVGRVAAALAALALVVGGVELWRNRFETGESPSSDERISIANVGDVVVVKHPGHGARLLWSVGSELPNGVRTGRIQIILRKGESP